MTIHSMKRRVFLSAVLSTCLAIATSASVAAVPPTGVCPRPFETGTYAEIMATFPQVGEAFGEEAALAALMSFDNNSNGTLCWIAHPTHSRSYETQVLVANVIDDNAAPHE
jgi:hypothetical protein